MPKSNAKTLKITLTGSGGELCSETVKVRHSNDPDEAANLQIHNVIEAWILSPGDTITIAEA